MACGKSLLVLEIIQREAFAGQVDTVGWSELHSHAEAGRLFIVASDLDIVDVAVAVANDQAAEVEGWVASGKLLRPSSDQMQAYESREGVTFHFVIVSPFVLAQE